MGLFESSEEKNAKKQFNEQMNIQNDSNDFALAQQLNEQGRVAFEPQVSAMLLEQSKRFLPWKLDSKSGMLYLPEKYKGLNEPYGEEARGFLTDEEKLLLYDIDANWIEIFNFGEKFGFDDNVIQLFNNMVNFRLSFLLGSRTTGKPQRLAKSFFVGSQSRIERGTPNKQKSEKLLGLF